MSPLQQAPHKCHNCRRRRLVCDRTLPTCRKCALLGQECLGFGKLILFTGAVATRGRHAGQTSFAPPPQTPGPRPHLPHVGGRNASSSPSASPVAAFSSPSPPPVSASSLSSRELVPSRYGSSSRSLSPEPRSFDSDGLTLHSLVDPVIQDFDSATKYYLHYYVERVTQDLVVYDTPDRNPFRNLVPLCQRHAFLRHVVVALSAVHQVSYLRSRGQPFRAKLLDALAAKHKAIVLIKDALENLGPHNYGDVLTAVVYLVNFDLVDSGRDSWQAHIVAAGRLMAMLRPAAPVTTAVCESASSALLSSMRGDRTADSSIETLRDYVMSDCLTFFILGSTLSSWQGTRAAEVFDSLDVVSMLLRAEANTYHSCPSEILAAILRSSQLAAEMRRDGGGGEGPSPSQKEAAAGLMRRLCDFDGRRWAESIVAAHGYGGTDDPDTLDKVRGREHMACAHRSAACAYLLMAAFEAFEGDGRGEGDGDDVVQATRTATEGFASDIFQHLACIAETDMLFKGSVWPTFILGALTADPDRRAWVLRRLEKMWFTICPWGYVKTALDTLVALWELRDGREQPMPSAAVTGGAPVADGRDAMRGGWLSELRALRINCLIV
ncbi:acriflavine sensitivity control protein acr-2 [Magnaporthiopsis poae ATCC 64411]|uniref:Acriflavine sensitivity control protein acr-2 n=1 Tax=Magnaporthiopsis poae (strain ATCC 64411 / 73-15) TaxID=644358 RepID=A0A0C4DXF4_MAGP6|nr:acriflavine sensitivity control protein acr-2 [Magnaporthiopsis poae ATCC 64411]